MNTDYQGQDALYREEPGAPARSAEPSPENGAEAEPGMEALLRDADYAFRRLRRGETVEGTIVRVDQDEVLVDVGLKSEGIIPSRELHTEGEQTEPLNVGDRVLVFVIHPEGQEGHAILSLRRARAERAWRDLEDDFHRGAIIEAPVVDFNKGGLIVDVQGIRGFVPVSQVLDLRNVGRQEGENEEVANTLAAMKGRRLPLKVIEMDRRRNRLILSERAAVQERRTQRKDELMDQLEAGQIRRGVVSNLTSFGAFIDLGGADGLVHVSELSYNRVNQPSEVLQVGQEADVYVLSVDRESKKIALSLKRALPDPWTIVDEKYRVGQVVPAVITKLAKFGAFAKVEEGLEGLIHLSELTDLPVQDAAAVVNEGQPVDVKIIHINSQRRRLGLSVRQAIDPRDRVESYGDIDPTNPFAIHDFGSFEGLQADELQPEVTSELAPPSPEDDQTAGVQDSPDAEYEPQAALLEAAEPVAEAPDEAPPVSPELPSVDEEDEAAAAATAQGSVSE